MYHIVGYLEQAVGIHYTLVPSLLTMAHQVSPVLIIYLEKKECITQNGLCEMIILITSRTGIKPTVVSCWAWSYDM